MYIVYRDMGEENESEFRVKSLNDVKLMEKHLPDYTGYSEMKFLTHADVVEIIADYIVGHKSDEFFETYCKHCDLKLEECLNCPNGENNE